LFEHKLIDFDPDRPKESYLLDLLRHLGRFRLPTLSPRGHHRVNEMSMARSNLIPEAHLLLFKGNYILLLRWQNGEHGWDPPVC